MTECNVDDIICQLEVLKNLRELQKGLGTDWFRNKFPELEGVDTKLSESITEQNETIRQAMERCNKPEDEDEQPWRPNGDFEYEEE